MTDEEIDSVCDVQRTARMKDGGPFFCPWIGEPEYEAHLERKAANIARMLLESANWTDATLANSYLVNFTDLLPENEAVELMRWSRAAKLREILTLVPMRKGLCTLVAWPIEVHACLFPEAINEGEKCALCERTKVESVMSHIDEIRDRNEYHKRDGGDDCFDCTYNRHDRPDVDIDYLLSEVHRMELDMLAATSTAERYRMRAWGLVSPSSNLHSIGCTVECTNPTHYPEGDPFNQSETTDTETDKPAPPILSTEHFDPDESGFGFLIQINSASESSCGVTVLAISGIDPQKDINDQIIDTEPYLTARMKWDGCFHFNFEPYFHFCSVHELKLHCKLIKRLHALAYEQMHHTPEPGEEWIE